jgi:hypothetical protein
MVRQNLTPTLPAFLSLFVSLQGSLSHSLFGYAGRVTCPGPSAPTWVVHEVCTGWVIGSSQVRRGWSRTRLGERDLTPCD